MVIQCPECGATATTAVGKPYCSQCGWNRAYVESQLRWSVKATPFAGVMFLVFVSYFVLGGRPRNSFDWTLILSVLGIPMALGYFFTFRALRKLQATPPATGTLQTIRDGASNAPAPEGSAGDAIKPGELDRALLDSLRPRPVRLNSTGRSALIFLPLVLAAVEILLGVYLYTIWAPVQSFSSFQSVQWALLGLSVLLLFAPLASRRAFVQQRELMTNGEAVLARVIGQWQSKNNRTIRYEFSDNQGGKHTQMASDTTRSLYEGMHLVVFYDSLNPERQAAACASYYEVVSPAAETARRNLGPNNPASRDKRQVQGLVTLFGYFLVLCSVLLLAAAGWRSWKEHYIVSKWRPATARVQKCSLQTDHPFTDEGGGTIYSLRCRIDYQTDGGSYDAVLSTTSTRSVSLRDQIRAWSARHRPGSEIAILVNPANRKEFAVQEPLPVHQRPTASEGLTGALPFGIAGVALSAIGLKLQSRK